jgi:hypothetical protein
MTFERWFVASLSSSPMVEAIRRRGLDAFSSGKPFRSRDCSSSTLLMLRPFSRSGQSLAMMPVSAGQAPVIMVAWPGAV